MKDRTLVEVCCSSLDSVLTAQHCGADRIELCSQLSLDGLTPDVELLEQVSTQSSLPIHVLIRPRAGDFHYSLNELAVIQTQIMAAMQYPISGIVVGQLTKEMQLDQVLLREWREMTQGIEVTFHRAFDRAKYPFMAIENLVEARFNRVLTSGQKPSALEGIELLKEMTVAAENRITIMPGGGIHQHNASEFVEQGFEAIHLSAKSPDLPEGMEPSVVPELLNQVVKIAHRK